MLLDGKDGVGLIVVEEEWRCRLPIVVKFMARGSVLAKVDGNRRERWGLGVRSSPAVEEYNGRQRGGASHGSEWPEANCCCWMWHRIGAHRARGMVEVWPPYDSK